MDLLAQLLGIAIGVASIVVTLIVFQSGLYTKTDILLAITENLGGTLTEEQARDLSLSTMNRDVEANSRKGDRRDRARCHQVTTREMRWPIRLR